MLATAGLLENKLTCNRPIAYRVAYHKPTALTVQCIEHIRVLHARCFTPHVFSHGLAAIRSARFYAWRQQF